MRITSNIIQREALGSMQSNLRAIAKAQREAGSGLRIHQASDDPAGTASSMQARGSLRALEQYRRNISSASSRAGTEESVLDQLNHVVVRAKELALSQGGATANDTTRLAAKAEVDELIAFAVQLGNTKLGEQYLFGGAHADQAPFDATLPGFVPVDGGGVPISPDGANRTEIYAGHFLVAAHDGQEVFLDSGVLQSLQDLSDALSAANPDVAVRGAISGLDSSHTELQRLLGEVGARTNQLDVTSANLESLKVTLQTLRADAEEVDFEEAVTELISRQTAFQAAMLATSRVMGLTLADYLR